VVVALLLLMPAVMRAVLCRFECIDRLVQGLSALFLALRRRPVIRYQKSSSAAQRLAEGLYALTYKQQVRAQGRCCHCRLAPGDQRSPLSALSQAAGRQGGSGSAASRAVLLCHHSYPRFCVCLVFLQTGVFDFGSRSSPLVLLLDRNDDPVTPLLTQWTYQVG
jgi:hypothetical protein